MALPRVTSPEAVQQAVAEYDEIVPERFYEKYGYGPARGYFLVVDGQRYDSKAILAAAQVHESPDLGIPENNFSAAGAFRGRSSALGSRSSTTQARNRPWLSRLGVMRTFGFHARTASFSSSLKLATYP